MPGLYRTVMTFGIILLVGTVIFYILALITLNIDKLSDPGIEPLVSVLRDLAIILGTGLATIIAFYFGIRGSESSVERAAAAITSRISPDRILPTIISTSPIDGDENFPTNSPVQVVFSQPMNKSTVNRDTFVLRKKLDNSVVSGVIILSPDEKTATFDPDGDFLSETDYAALVTTGVQDLAGNHLDSNKSWSFKTGKLSNTEIKSGDSDTETVRDKAPADLFNQPGGGGTENRTTTGETTPSKDKAPADLFKK
jgi:hypothetical protein